MLLLERRGLWKWKCDYMDVYLCIYIYTHKYTYIYICKSMYKCMRCNLELAQSSNDKLRLCHWLDLIACFLSFFLYLPQEWHRLSLVISRLQLGRSFRLNTLGRSRSPFFTISLLSLGSLLQPIQLMENNLCSFAGYKRNSLSLYQLYLQRRFGQGEVKRGGHNRWGKGRDRGIGIARVGIRGGSIDI